MTGGHPQRRSTLIRDLRWRRLLAMVAAPMAFVMCGGVSMTSTAAAAVSQPYVNTFNYGNPDTPHAIVPADLDVQIHVRSPVDQMTDPMAAGHGPDCSAPPATHLIQNLSDGLFACKNHMMTAIADDNYGEIALTPNHMADWSTGTTTITFYVSTQQFNASDWLELWLTPFTDNTSLPFSSADQVDFQGPPRNALIFSLDQSELMATKSGDVTPVQNYVLQNPLPKIACTYIPDPQCINAYGATSVVPLSAVTRVEYEIDISQGHIRFGIPGLVWWTDTDVTVPFSQALVTLAHHSYNPLKHDPGTGIDTYHWSNLAISNAVPFTMINGAERVINADTSSTIHFPAPAPTGSYLRFSALGKMSVSWDGGATWNLAVMQGLHTHDEHFQTYMTPIPPGTTSVQVRGVDNQYAQPWWVRDPAIWSKFATPPPPNAPIVSSLSPTNGPPAGGTAVIITGRNFTGATSVNFGGVPASSFTVDSDTQITATSPASTGTVDVTVTTSAGTSAASQQGKFAFTSPAAYTAVAPVRLMDTRLSGGALGTAGLRNLKVAGVTPGAPAGATAVVVNVTVTDTTAPSFLTVFPTGAIRPLASNLNYVAGATIPNLVSVQVGSGGAITFFNAAGSTDVVVDLEGYYAAPSGSAGGEVALAPARITDTRANSGLPNAGSTLGAGRTINVQVTGAGGVPSSGVSAAILNVTVTNTTASSFLTVWPAGATRPTASNLNWMAGETIPNRVIVPIGSGGRVSVFNPVGSADVIIDVSGYFTDSTASGKFFYAEAPIRLADTRISAQTLSPNGSFTLPVAGLAGVPGGATAVVLNVTVTGTTSASFLTVYPSSGARPLASDLNWVPGQTIPNLVVATLGSTGAITFFNALGRTDVIVDLAGWYS